MHCVSGTCWKKPNKYIVQAINTQAIHTKSNSHWLSEEIKSIILSKWYKITEIRNSSSTLESKDTQQRWPHLIYT